MNLDTDMNFSNINVETLRLSMSEGAMPNIKESWNKVC